MKELDIFCTNLGVWMYFFTFPKCFTETLNSIPHPLFLQLHATTTECKGLVWGFGTYICWVQFYFPRLDEVSSFLFHFGYKGGNGYYFYKYDLVMSCPSLLVGIMMG